MYEEGVLKVTEDSSNVIFVICSVKDLYLSRLIGTNGVLLYLFNLDTWSVCNGRSRERDQVILPTIAE